MINDMDVKRKSLWLNNDNDNDNDNNNDNMKRIKNQVIVDLSKDETRLTKARKGAVNTSKKYSDAFKK